MIWTINELLLLVLAFAVLMVVLEFGFRMGLRASATSDEFVRDHVSLLQGSVLGLLALLLGFTFAMAVERYDLRKALVLEEANAIGTTALRAAHLPPPHDEQARLLLHQYVSARLEFYASGLDVERLARAQDSAAELQKKLWALTVTLAQEQPRSVPVGLFIETLNDLIDDSEKRTAALDNRVPGAVIVLLFAVAGVAMSLIAYHCGLAGHRRLGLNALFALLIAVVITIILDIDRPRSGLVHVSQGSMERLRDSLIDVSAVGDVVLPASVEDAKDVPLTPNASQP